MCKNNIVIKLVNVEKTFNRQILFSNVNFEIAEGSIVGFAGGNGSGKSVLFKLISGLYSPDHGEIFIRGEKLGQRIDFPENMGILIDTPGFIDIYSGFNNLKLLADIRKKISDDKIIKTMKLVGLDPENKTKVKNYSLGMKQKLAITQAIMEEQDIIILDEPFNALDAESNEKVKLLLLNLKKSGKTILLTSHNAEDLLSLCDVKYEFKNHELICFS